MKRQVNNNADICNLDHRTVLIVSRAKSGKSNAEVAVSMGLGEETVARFQREPHPGEHEYSMSIRKVAGWNRAVGNDDLIRWLCAQSGGVFVRNARPDTANADLSRIITEMTHEMADVVEREILDMRDNNRTPDEVRKMLKELRDVLEKIHAAVMSAEQLLEGSRRP